MLYAESYKPKLFKSLRLKLHGWEELMKEKQRILRDGLLYSISTYISTIVNFFTSIVTKNLLGPTLAGTFNFFMLIRSYTEFGELGIRYSINREIPLNKGMSDFKKVQDIKNTSYTATLLFSGIINSIVLLVAIIFRNQLSRMMYMGLMLVAVISFVSNIINYYFALVRADRNFVFLCKYNILYALLAVVFKISLVYWLGIYGLLIGIIILHVVMIFYFVKRTKHNLKLEINPKILKSLLKLGLPLLMLGFISLSILGIDKYIITIFLDFTELGHYSIATMVHSFVIVFPGLLSSTLFPSFLQKIGRDGTHLKARSHVIKPNIIIAYIYAIIIIFVALLMPIFVKYVMPKFTQGILAAQILVIGTFFMGIKNISGQVLVGLNKIGRLIIFGAIVLVLAFLLDMVFIKLGMGIIGIALASAISFFVYSFILMFDALRLMEFDFFSRMKHILSLYVPLILILAVMLMCNRILSLFGFEGIGLFLFQVFILAIASVPILYVLNKKTSVVRMTYDLLIKYKHKNRWF